jgi:hypothetical protein
VSLLFGLRGSKLVLAFLILLSEILLGVAGGIASSRFPACGKAGSAFALGALAGLPLSVAFC